MKPQAETPAAPGTPAFEESDLPSKPIAWVGVAVAISFLIIGCFLVWLLHFDADGGLVAKSVGASQGTHNGIKGPPPLAEPPVPPELTISETQEYERLRARQVSDLNSYGRRSDGSWHVPIEVAMTLLLKQGLPARPLPKRTATPVPRDDVHAP